MKFLKPTLAAAAALATLPAYAQNSVTLYGVVDTGIVYQNNQASLGATSGGHSAVKFAAGIWNGNRFGLQGSEDLGSGTKVLFKLESGFNVNTGAQQYANALFGRQSYVGFTNPQYGTLTAGRQYTSYYTMLAPYSPTTWLTGFFGAHPGDVDSLDTNYRANNELVYTSPTLGGVTLSGSYALGGVAGSFNRGSTWSAGAQYAAGPFGVAAGVQRVNNSTPGGGAWGADSTTTSGGEVGVSSVTSGYQTAAAQQRIAVDGDIAFARQWDLSFSYSNVQYIPGTNSAFANTAIFNTAGAVLHYKPSPALDLAAGYSYTRTTKANGITNAASYQQFSLGSYYSLSKRTALYALAAFQRAHGDTLGPKGAGNIITANATVGDGTQSTPSSTNSVLAAGVGIVHRF